MKQGQKPKTDATPVRTETQTSAGAVVYKKRSGKISIALISVGDKSRWQLPKGLVESNEEPAEAALREVLEETGLESKVVQPIDKIEYWYFASRRDTRIRYHKFVHFFLARYIRGSVQNHDREVNEARWFEASHGLSVLAFKSEADIVRKAISLISDES